MVRSSAREEIFNHIARMPEEQLKQVLYLVRALTAESAGSSPGYKRLRLRHILREAGPELFSGGEATGVRPVVQEIKRVMAI